MGRLFFWGGWGRGETTTQVINIKKEWVAEKGIQKIG